MKRNIYFALLLSLLIPGLGYVYIGKKIWFGMLILLAFISEVAWRVAHQGFVFDAFLLAFVIFFYAAILGDTYMTAKQFIDEQDSAGSKTS